MFYCFSEASSEKFTHNRKSSVGGFFVMPHLPLSRWSASCRDFVIVQSITNPLAEQKALRAEVKQRT